MCFTCDDTKGGLLMMTTDENMTALTDTVSVQTIAHPFPPDGILISNLLQTTTEEGSVFSVAVTLFSDTFETDARLIRDVSRNRKEAENLFLRITAGAVTPCTLADVLEDLL
jgi:hypothetical protein